MVLLNKSQVAELLGVKPRTVIEKYRNRPDFPKPYSISAKALRWSKDEVLGFVQSCR